MKIFSKEKLLSEEKELIGESISEYKSNSYEVGESSVGIFWKIKKRSFYDFQLFKIEYGEWWRWVLPFLLKKRIEGMADLGEVWDFRARPNEKKISINGSTRNLCPDERMFEFAELDLPPLCLSEPEDLVEVPCVSTITINFWDFKTFGMKHIIPFNFPIEIRKQISQRMLDQIAIPIEQETKRVLERINDEHGS